MTMATQSSTFSQGSSNPSHNNNPLQHNDPKVTNLQGQAPSKDIFWDLRGTIREQFNAWKFLLSKLVYEGFESLSEKEIHCLYLLKVRLTSVRDMSWIVQNFNSFKLTKRIFGAFQNMVQSGRCRNFWNQEILKNPFFSQGLLTPCDYFGRRTFFNVKTVLRRVNLALKKKPRQPNRIGVGYRDHGTARDVAWDGSPTWQEVAVALQPTDSPSSWDQEEAYRTYLWKLSGAKEPYHLFHPHSF